MSGVPSINGTRKFPNPPIMKGITVKKIIINACLIINELKTESLLRSDPHVLNSNRIIILIEDPNIPAQNEKIKYNIPISLWLVE
jgi:hypothetical protein